MDEKPVARLRASQWPLGQVSAIQPGLGRGFECSGADTLMPSTSSEL